MKKLLPLLAMFFVAAPAYGQVNTEKLRSTTEGFSGAADFSLFVRRGNLDLTKVGTSLRMQHVTLHPPETTTSTTVEPLRRPKSLVLLIGNLTLGIRNSSDRYINNGFSHLRWTRMWHPMIGSETFAQLQYNEFLRLKQRLLLGGGLRAKPVFERWGDVSFGSAAMLEIEEVSEDLGVEEPSTRVVRWSNYASISLYLDDPNVGVVNTFYVQPRFDDFSDYRILNESELTIGVTNALSFVVAGTILFDNRPPAEVEKLDIIITHSISVTF